MALVCRIGICSFSCVLLVCFSVGCNSRSYFPWRHGGDDSVVDTAPEAADAEAVDEEPLDVGVAAAEGDVRDAEPEVAVAEEVELEVSDADFLVAAEGGMPDLLQTDPVAAFAGGGKSYSAPVAVSNSLAALSRRGYGRLMLVVGDAKAAQIAVVKHLSGADYMDNSAASGATVSGIVEGLGRYLNERGYGIEELKHEGLRLYPDRREASESSLVDLDWIAEAMADDGGAVWLNLGWYIYAPEEDVYQKKGGHWVTLAAYSAESRDALNRPTMMIHDPSPRSGVGPSAERITLTAIRSGVIKGYGLPQDAKGYYDVEGIAYPIECNRAILEGAIVLRLQPPGATE
jgi:hypothetical protein